MRAFLLVALLALIPGEADANRYRTQRANSDSTAKSKASKQTNKARIPRTSLLQRQKQSIQSKKLKRLPSRWKTSEWASPARNGVAKNYAFLVHGASALQLTKGIKSTSLAKHPLLYTSFISDRANSKEVRTFGHTGVILDVAPSNIAGNYHDDTASQIGTRQLGDKSLHQLTPREVLKKVKVRYPPSQIGFGHRNPPTRGWGIDSPSKLSGNTHTGLYNEVLVMGTSPSGNKAKITGVFLRIDVKGNHLAKPEERAAFEKFAKKHNVPIVLIPYRYDSKLPYDLQKSPNHLRR